MWYVIKPENGYYLVNKTAQRLWQQNWGCQEDIGNWIEGGVGITKMF